MFSRLVASARGQSQFRRPAVIGGSLAAHAALLAGIVWVSSPAPSDTAADPQAEEEVTFIDVSEIPPPPEAVFEAPPAEPTPQQRPTPQVAARSPAAPRNAEPRRTTAPSAAVQEPAGFQELRTPPIVVGSLPVDPSQTPVRAEDFGGRGAPGGTAGGTPAAPAGTSGSGTAAAGSAGSPTGTFSATMVDRTAVLSNRDEIVRLLRRLYPRTLSETRVEGSVQVQFVITADGRVDMSTVEITSATDDLFRDVSMRVLREFRFRPARKGAHNVRMLTTLPIQWKLERR
jgi:periplasmic protein TonB